MVRAERDVAAAARVCGAGVEAGTVREPPQGVAVGADRVDVGVAVRARQTDVLQWGRPGGDLEDGKLLRASEGMRIRVEAYGARASREGWRTLA